MNGVDVVILVLLAIALLTGFRQGFVVELALIAGVFIALAVAKVGYTTVRTLLETVAPKGAWLTTISYLLVFVVVWGAVVGIARGIRRGMRMLLLGGADRLAGALLGLIQGAIVVELLLYFGKRVPNHDLHRLIAQSKLAPKFTEIVPYVHQWFPHVPAH